MVQKVPLTKVETAVPVSYPFLFNEMCYFVVVCIMTIALRSRRANDEDYLQTAGVDDDSRIASSVYVLELASLHSTPSSQVWAALYRVFHFTK